MKINHNDDGRIESLIAAARRRLWVGGIELSSIFDDLIAIGASNAEAHHAIIAAQLLEGTLDG